MSIAVDDLATMAAALNRLEQDLAETQIELKLSDERYALLLARFEARNDTVNGLNGQQEGVIRPVRSVDIDVIPLYEGLVRAQDRSLARVPRLEETLFEEKSHSQRLATGLAATETKLDAALSRVSSLEAAVDAAEKLATARQHELDLAHQNHAAAMKEAEARHVELRDMAAAAQARNVALEDALTSATQMAEARTSENEALRLQLGALAQENLGAQQTLMNALAAAHARVIALETANEEASRVAAAHAGEVARLRTEQAVALESASAQAQTLSVALEDAKTALAKSEAAALDAVRLGQDQAREIQRLQDLHQAQLQQVGASAAAREQLSAEMTAAQDALKAARDEAAILRQQVAGYETRLNHALANSKADRAQLSSTIDALRLAEEKHKRDADALRVALEQARAELKSNQGALLATKGEYEELQRQFAKVSEQLAGLTVECDTAVANALAQRAALETASTKLEANFGALHTLKGEYATLQQQLASAAEQIDALTAARDAALERAERDSSQLEALRAARLAEHAQAVELARHLNSVRSQLIRLKRMPVMGAFVRDT